MEVDHPEEFNGYRVQSHMAAYFLFETESSEKHDR